MLEEIGESWFKIGVQLLGLFSSFVLGIVAATLALAKLIRGFEKKQIETDNEVGILKTAVLNMRVDCADNRVEMKEAITSAVREGMSGAEGRWGIELAGANASREKLTIMLENLQKTVDTQQDAINRIHERIDDVALVGRKVPR